MEHIKERIIAELAALLGIEVAATLVNKFFPSATGPDFFRLASILAVTAGVCIVVFWRGRSNSTSGPTAGSVRVPGATNSGFQMLQKVAGGVFPNLDPREVQDRSVLLTLN